MELEIYIDVIFLINFIMDFILLLIVRKIMKSPGKVFRLLGGAAIGAAGACILALLPDLNGLVQFLFSYIILCSLMVAAALPLRSLKTGVKAVLVLYASTFLLGGIMNSLYYYSRLGYYFQELIQGNLFQERSMRYFILAGLGALLFFPVSMECINWFRKGKQELYPAELFYGKRSVRLVGLLDTGNDLHDPIYGKPVLVAQYSAVEPLLTKSQAKMICSVLDTFEGKPDTPENDRTAVCDGISHEAGEEVKITMIPYHSVGRKNGMLPAILLSRLVIQNGREQVCSEKILAAVSRNQLSRQNEYQIILHKDMV